MASTRDNKGSPPKRRVPQQVRSRDRVQRILEVTGDLVVSDGVDSLSTRAIASAAGVPVASLYQYFADKEEILLALVERDLAEMDAQVAEDLAALRELSVRAIVETTINAFVKVYHRRPSFVVIWMRGRTNAAIRDYGRAHNQRMARELFAVAKGSGMVLPESTGRFAELAVEVADRLFQIAFEESLTADPLVVDEAVTMVTAYLEKHATDAGITGIPVPGAEPPPAG
ncbi:MAG: TetR/AcrR family transcriptional regulator [Nocardioidaceae bacterium]|nr:TetR/AcrR family transcriptional regulator [Nocardioidaceae bacterium]NUS52332.1 TetR/AcrR family transcriptional regulator [Nocardioidaceae bacterium]